jgi:ferredoxin-NADP reductase
VVRGWMAGTVVSAMRATDNGRILMIDVPGWPGNIAGQHLDLRLTAEDGYQAVRSYSIASVGTGTVIELAVDELPDGEVSPYLVEDVQPGDQLEVRGPLGGFFVWRETQPEPVQLVAGGSGVVPLLAMARAHAASGSDAPFRMLYSVRSPEHAYYTDELATLEGDHLMVHWVYTRQAPPGWPSAPGRLTREIAEAATFPPRDEPSVYVCGPTGFVEATASLLLDLGHPSSRVRTERFGGS